MKKIEAFFPFFWLQSFANARLLFPQSRNQKTPHDCPHCANGDAVCGAGGEWRADETASDRLLSRYTTDLVRLVAGRRVEVAFDGKTLATYHGGTFVLELCVPPVDRDADPIAYARHTLAESCFFRLERDPTDDRFSPPIVEQTSYGFLPLFEPTSFRRRYSTADTNVKMIYRIPEVVNGPSHGILRWYFQPNHMCLSSNYLTMPATDNRIAYFRTVNGLPLQLTTIRTPCGDDCPATSCARPRFKNCADVLIDAPRADDPAVVTPEEGAGVAPVDDVCVAVLTHEKSLADCEASVTFRGVDEGLESHERGVLERRGWRGPWETALQEGCENMCQKVQDDRAITDLCVAAGICDLAECAVFWASRSCRLRPTQSLRHP